MELTNEGLTLWYGTPDAPAPYGDIVAGVKACLTVAVRPANPTNSLRVIYRVDESATRILIGRELRVDYGSNTQYFKVDFPLVTPGSVVGYCPVLTCCGRTVPAREPEGAFPSRFFVVAARAKREDLGREQAVAQHSQEFGAVLRFLAAVRVRLNPPVFVGESPEGVRIDVFAAGGTVTGPKLKGVVVPGSSDHLFVRPDGVGVLRIRAIFALNDGAMIEVEERGSVDFGSNGYDLAAEGRLPSHSQVTSSARLLTGASHYSWLNRRQCVGVGRTNLDDLTFAYDLFTVDPDAAVNEFRHGC